MLIHGRTSDEARTTLCGLPTKAQHVSCDVREEPDLVSCDGCADLLALATGTSTVDTIKRVTDGYLGYVPGGPR